MGLFRSVLAPLDGSDQSEAACGLAVRIAADQKSSLTFMNVIESQRVIASVMPVNHFADPTTVNEQLRAAGQEILRKALDAAHKAGLNADTQLIEGDTVETIVEYAKSAGTDLIVMGSHGRSGFERLILGSVAEGVLRRSALPVTIAKLKPPD